MPRRLLPALGLLLAGCSPVGLANALAPRGGIALREGLVYGPLPRQRLDLYLPERVEATTPLVVFIHGGGWDSGARGEYGFVARALAARGIAVAVPDYRLWPEARWPDFNQDAARAVAWLRAAPDIPRGPLFLMGHSAGGYIAAALCLDPRWLAEAGLPGGRGALAGGMLLAAPISWQPDDQPIMSIFATAPGGRIEAVPDPAMLAEAPPMLLLHGLADTTVGPFHSERLAAALQAAGRRVRLRTYAGMGHTGVIAAMVGLVRGLGLARGPVLEEVVSFVAG